MTATVIEFNKAESLQKGTLMHSFNTDRLDSDSLGARLTRSRLRHGWTQHALAHNVGTSQAVVQRIETGKCRHPRNIDRLADILDVSPAWLMYGAEVMDGLELEAIETAKAWANLTEPHRTALKEMIIKIAED
jgi:transcriptional regulator with XRE-family HTH domain